eukprot:g3941.t1
MYWLVSFPCGPTDNEKSARWADLVTKTQSLVPSPSRLSVPKLKVGTLDSLLALSDDMAKFNALIEATVLKLKRQFLELSRLDMNRGGDAATAASTGLSIDGQSVQDYLKNFHWEEAKYPSNRPLKETVEKIQETVAKIEDDMKVKVGEYNHMKGTLSAIARKTAGSLAVKDLSGLVKAEHFITTDYLTTLLVVVSKFNVKDWINTYERLNQFVLPRSSKTITEDHEFALVTVVLFSKEVENFRTAARGKGYQVRDFVFVEEETEAQKENIIQIKADAANKKLILEEWCQTSYGEVFSAWTHMLVIRLFVESILRYGLPPSFIAGVIETKTKIEKKLRTILQAFGDDLWTGMEDGPTGGALGPAVESENLPYVSYTIDPEN